MKRHLQCAEQQVSRSNLTKYCTCHAERLACFIVVTYETSFTMRAATGVTIQPDQILRLPRRKTCMLHRRYIWNVFYNARSNRCHSPASPNAELVTKNDTAKFQRECPETGESSFPMRGRSKNETQTKHKNGTEKAKKRNAKKMRQNKGVWIPKQRANKKNGKKQNSNSRTAGRTESKHKNGTEKAKNAKRKKSLKTIWFAHHLTAAGRQRTNRKKNNQKKSKAPRGDPRENAHVKTTEKKKSRKRAKKGAKTLGFKAVLKRKHKKRQKTQKRSRTDGKAKKNNSR